MSIMIFILFHFLLINYKRIKWMLFINALLILNLYCKQTNTSHWRVRCNNNILYYILLFTHSFIPVSQPVSQSVHSFIWSASQLAIQPTSQSINQLIDRSIDRSIIQSINPINQSSSQMDVVNESICQSPKLYGDFF